MSRTCEPASLALQIVQAVLLRANENNPPHERERIVREEFSRHTMGLYEYERQQVLAHVAAELRGAI